MTRFGLILPIQKQGGELGTLMSELRAEVAAADAAGFDAFFLPEFHQARGGAIVSPLLVAAYLVASTRRIRAGTLVLAGPLHDPVRLAEDVLMLDHATGGRVILGVGPGHLPNDFELFDRPHAERSDNLDELLDLLERCWSGEPFEHRGRFYERRGQVTPAPRTSPRPQIWIGAHTRRGLARAARRADAWVCDPQRDIPTVARLADVYRQAAASSGRPARVVLFREGWVAGSREEAEEVWAPHALAVHRLYYNVGAYRRHFEPWVDEVRDRAAFTLDRLAPGRFLFGDAKSVREEARAWLEATGADTIAVRLRFPGGPSHEETLVAIRRFGEEVISPLAAGPIPSDANSPSMTRV
jgi:alkanesulfonate monooxygenase SsuD/methylene tetrahydromethanopterin reductase-like flavin-dependent oxidoreductase (luciferase family)